MIERDEDEEEAAGRQRQPAGRANSAEDGVESDGQEGRLRFRGAEQEGPWAELSGRKGKGAVYSDQDRNVEEGPLNRVRARLGLPLLQPPASDKQGAFAKAIERARSKVKSLLGFDEDEVDAKQLTQGRLERIDRDRAV